ncbi:MAG: hypothetical protein HY231_17825 [Acidobacteria bacterium]|nr:hypothetical protein [Acidobacteriota bacterium]
MNASTMNPITKEFCDARKIAAKSLIIAVPILFGFGKAASRKKLCHAERELQNQKGDQRSASQSIGGFFFPFYNGASLHPAHCEWQNQRRPPLLRSGLWPPLNLADLIQQGLQEWITMNG